MALHISLNPRQKLTSKLCAFVTLHRLSNSPLSSLRNSDFFCTVTVVMKRNALLGILEKLAGDHRTALEHELLELPRKQNGTAWHYMQQNGTEWTMIARTSNGTVC